MDEDLYDHPLVEPLVSAGPEVPVKAIEELSRALRRSRSLAARVNRLFRFESSFRPEDSGYLVVWLAFALALARDEEAMHTFMDLFELVDPVEHDMLWELAQFALWQYGDEAVREVLQEFDRVLEVDHTGYFLGVLEAAGASRDQLLRRRVSDRVLEALRSRDVSPPLVLNLLDIALILEDPRLPGIVEGWKQRLSPEQRRLLEGVEELFLDGEAVEAAADYRRPWQELAALAAEHFAAHMTDDGPVLEDGGDLSELLDREYRAKLDLLVEAWEETAGLFVHSPRFLELPPVLRESRAQTRDLLMEICRLAAGEYEVLLEDLDPEELGRLLTHTLPHRLVLEGKRFEAIPDLLLAFFRHMREEGLLEKEEERDYAESIREARPHLVRRGSDPSCWSEEKKELLRKKAEGKGEGGKGSGRDACGRPRGRDPGPEGD